MVQQCPYYDGLPGSPRDFLYEETGLWEFHLTSNVWINISIEKFVGQGIVLQ